MPPPTASTWYVQIRPLNSPIDIGPDKNQRATWGFNVLAEKRPSDTCEEEIGQVIINASVTTAANIFFSTDARLPDPGGSDFLTVTQTSGMKPGRTQNESNQVSYENASVHVEAHAADAKAARALARAAWKALIAIVNTTVIVP